MTAINQAKGPPSMPRRPEPLPAVFGAAPAWATVTVREDGTGKFFSPHLSAIGIADPRADGLWFIAWRDQAAPDGWRSGEATLDCILIALGWHVGLHVCRQDQADRFRAWADALPALSRSVH